MNRLHTSTLLLVCLSIVLIAAACVPMPPPAAAPTIAPATKPAVAPTAAPTAAPATKPAAAPAAAPTAAPSSTITNIVWQWTSVKDRPTGTTTTVPNPQNYTITFRNDGTLSGKADCNTFTGTYTQASGFDITLTPSTMAACAEGSLSQQYLQLLDAVVAGGPDGAGGLALETAGGEKRMQFKNGGAAASSAPAPSSTITNIVWQWTSVKDRPTGTTTTVPNPQNYTIIFRNDGTLSGKADCNTFTGSYSQQNGFHISVTPTVMAACGTLDSQYLTLLKQVAAGGPDGAGGLALETAGGEKRMTFVNGGAAP